MIQVLREIPQILNTFLPAGYSHFMGNFQSHIVVGTGLCHNLERMESTGWLGSKVSKSSYRVCTMWLGRMGRSCLLHMGSHRIHTHSRCRKVRMERRRNHIHIHRQYHKVHKVGRDYMKVHRGRMTVHKVHMRVRRVRNHCRMVRMSSSHMGRRSSRTSDYSLLS